MLQGLKVLCAEGCELRMMQAVSNREHGLPWTSIEFPRARCNVDRYSYPSTVSFKSSLALRSCLSLA